LTLMLAINSAMAAAAPTLPFSIMAQRRL